jgi:hypothetical protein
MEEENIYVRRNEELAELIDSFDGPPSIPVWGSCSREEQDTECGRRRVLKERGNLPWMEELAGALSMDTVEKVYDRDALDLSIKECQERKRKRASEKTQRNAKEKSVKEKTTALEKEKELIESQAMRYGELTGLGEKLVEEFLRLLETVRDHEILLGENLSDAAIKKRLREQALSFEASRPAEEGDLDRRADLLEKGEEVLWRSLFTPSTFFRLYLNNDARGATMRQIKADSSRMLQSTSYVFLLRERFTGVAQEPTTVPNAPPTFSASIPTDVEDSVLDWSLLEGSETALWYLLGVCSDAAFRNMVKLGCWASYRNHPNSSGTTYLSLMMLYLFSPDENKRKNVLHSVNILGGGVDGQPAPVLRVLHRVLREYNASHYPVMKELLIAHFTWCYFTQCSPLCIAHEWYTHCHDLELPSQDDQLLLLLTVAKAQLGEYLSLVSRLLFRKEGFHTIVDGRPLLRVPLTLTGQDFSLVKELDAMNNLFRGVTLNDLIANESFRQFARAYQRDVEGYPVLVLHTLLVAYFPFMENRLHSLPPPAPEDVIIVVDNDEEEEHEEEEEDIRLRPVVGYHVEKAYQTVQIYCPSLKGLPRKEFQEKHALESGLLNAYVTFVAALESEGKLFSTPNRPKSLHQRRHTLKNSRGALLALKHYSYRRLPGGHYRTEREERGSGLFRF